VKQNGSRNVGKAVDPRRTAPTNNFGTANSLTALGPNLFLLMHGHSRGNAHGLHSRHSTDSVGLDWRQGSFFHFFGRDRHDFFVASVGDEGGRGKKLTTQSKHFDTELCQDRSSFVGLSARSTDVDKSLQYSRCSSVTFPAGQIETA
jgi:hypothetical protein